MTMVAAGDNPVVGVLDARRCRKVLAVVVHENNTVSSDPLEQGWVYSGGLFFLLKLRCLSLSSDS